MSDDFFKNLLADHGIDPSEAEEIDPAPKPEKEYIPQPRIQTPHVPNSDPIKFKVGQWDEDRGEWRRLALPWPRWKRPGEVATDEEARAYYKEWNLTIEAQLTLERYLWFVATKHLRPGYFDVGIDNSEQLAVERLAWLTGVWNSRGYRCPDWNDFVAMAIEKPPKNLPTN